MNLPTLIKTFVLHFGEMGSRWGINRTVGEVYALLYLSEEALNADQIVESLGLSRSNVAMALKELSNMKLIMLKHIPSDRKDYYETHDDIWDIVRTLLEERQKREVEPTLNMLREITIEKATSKAEQKAQLKMQQMQELIELLTKWHHDMKKMETERLVKLLKMGSKIYDLYQLKDKLKLMNRNKE